MPTGIFYPHITKTGSESAHLERVPRVRVAQIAMDYLAHGWSPDEICRQHPYLRPSEVHAAMGYYFDHQDEIDAEIKSELNALEASKPTQPSPLVTRLRAKGIV